MYILNDSSLMTFGMFKGIRMRDIPAEYLLWIYDNRRWGSRRDLLIYLMEHEQALRKEVKRIKANRLIIDEINAAIEKDSNNDAVYADGL